jgi:hypothetical protein
MRIKISLSSYPDVDHIPGKRIQPTETIHSNYAAWVKHANAINSKYHDDLAEIENDNKKVTYDDDGVIFAVWDKEKKVGTVHLKGEHLAKH